MNKKQLTPEQELNKILEERDERKALSFAKRHPRVFYRVVTKLILDIKADVRKTIR